MYFLQIQANLRHRNQKRQLFRDGESTLQWLYTYVANIRFNCFTLFQYIATSAATHARSDSWASTCCTRRPYSTRHAPHGRACSRLTHMCTRVVLPPSLSHWGTRGVIALSLSCSWVSRIWARAMCSLSHWNMRAVFPLSCMHLGMQEDAWAAAGEGVRRSSRRRRVLPKSTTRGNTGHIRRNNV
jgi:hypothetical protein